MSPTDNAGMTLPEVLIAAFLISLIVLLGLKVIAIPMDMNIQAAQSAYVRTEQKSNAEAFFNLVHEAERVKLIDATELHTVQRGSDSVFRYKIQDDADRLDHKGDAAYKILTFGQMTKQQYKNHLDASGNLKPNPPWQGSEIITDLCQGDSTGVESSIIYNDAMRTIDIVLYLQYGTRVERMDASILRYVWLKDREEGGREFHDGF